MEMAIERRMEGYQLWRVFVLAVVVSGSDIETDSQFGRKGRRAKKELIFNVVLLKTWY